MVNIIEQANMKNNRKIKQGISATWIIGLVFTILGTVFLTVSIIMMTEYKSTLDEDIIIVRNVFSLIGIPFAVIGVLFIITNIRKSKKQKKLVADGFYVKAEITEVTINYSVRVNGRCPYVIHAAYKDSYGNVHIFRSRNIFYDPINLLKDNMVKVYVSRNETDNYKYYYMDIDEILPKVTMH